MERRLVPSLLEFARIQPYVRVMVPPVSGFALVYFALAFVFGGYFAAAYHLDPREALTGVPQGATLWGFVYLSLTTIFPLGYSPIRPISAPTEMIVSAEAVVGTAMLVVVFAALVAYLTPRFERVTERLRDEHALRMITQLQRYIENESETGQETAARIFDAIKDFIARTSNSSTARDNRQLPFPN